MNEYPPTTEKAKRQVAAQRCLEIAADVEVLRMAVERIEAQAPLTWRLRELIHELEEIAAGLTDSAWEDY